MLWILISISSNVLFLSLIASTAAWSSNFGMVIKPWLFEGDNRNFDKTKLQIFLILFTEKTKWTTASFTCGDAPQEIFSSTSTSSICWKSYQRFTLTCDILSSPPFHLIHLVSSSSGILLSRKIFNFYSSWMINIGSSKLVVNMLRGWKTEKTKDKIPC